MFVNRNLKFCGLNFWNYFFKNKTKSLNITSLWNFISKNWIVKSFWKSQEFFMLILSSLNFHFFESNLTALNPILRSKNTADNRVFAKCGTKVVVALLYFFRRKKTFPFPILFCNLVNGNRFLLVASKLVFSTFFARTSQNTQSVTCNFIQNNVNEEHFFNNFNIIF